MTQAIFIETAKAEMAAVDDKRRRLNVSGVLRILGVSRNGYYSFKHRKPSERQKHKESIEDKIIDIYDESHKNYGAPKITQKLHEIGEEISEKTVGNYMRELGIKAQYIKPYTATTTNSDFSSELKKYESALSSKGVTLFIKKNSDGNSEVSITTDWVIRKAIKLGREPIVFDIDENRKILAQLIDESTADDTDS